MRALAITTLIAAGVAGLAVMPGGAGADIVGLSAITPPVTTPLAFPGAEGFGAHTSGGRGGAVYHVTTLEDSGPGSLRAAIEAKGPRTVVFEVSGTIALKSPLEINNGQITIAGQSAPGDGIALRDHPLVVSAGEVIVRFIRVRLGDESRLESDAMWLEEGENIIIDHVSASWSTDETLSASQRWAPGSDRAHLNHVTVQWSIIAEPLNRSVHAKGDHGYGSLIRGSYDARYSWLHNLWAHGKTRMPRPGNYEPATLDPLGPLIDFRNNVIYNWAGGGTVTYDPNRDYSVPDVSRTHSPGYNVDKESASRYNFVNNAYVRGPNSGSSFAFREEAPYAKAYFSGNSMDGVVPEDPWSLVAIVNAGPDYKQAQPFEVPAMADESAAEALVRVLEHVGASHARDAADARVVASVRDRSGQVINSQAEVGGWPHLVSLPAPADTDRDGLPDGWEAAHGLDANDATDGAKVAAGEAYYTNLEVYLNGLVTGTY